MATDIRQILAYDIIQALQAASSPSLTNPFATISDVNAVSVDVTTLKNNEYKVTYYTIVSGASGTLSLPTGATLNSGEFGASGNAILSKINGSNKPIFQSPTDGGGNIVGVSLNTTTGAWAASGTYTDTSVAIIYSLQIKAIDYSNLTYANIIEYETTNNGINYTSPLLYTSGTNTVSITQSGATSDGYLSSTDWNTFNGKQAALSGTGIVLSTSGVISYISGTSAQLVSGAGSLLSSISASISTLTTTGWIVLTGTDVQTAFTQTDAALTRSRKTGIEFGGQGSIASTTTVTFQAGSGGIIDNTTSSLVYYPIAWSTQTKTQTSVAANTVTYWYVDSSNNIQQQTTMPTYSEWRTKVFLAKTTSDGTQITGIAAYTSPILQATVNFRDLNTFLGPLKDISGNNPTYSGANLKLKITGGSVYDYAANYWNSYTNDNVVTAPTFDSGLGMTFEYATTSGITASGLTDIDVAYYQTGGTKTAIPGTKYGIHYVFGLPTQAVMVVYGSSYYTSVTNAESAITTSDPYSLIPSAFKGNCLCLGAIICLNTATDLSTQGTFIPTNRFGLFGGSIATSGVGYLQSDGSTPLTGDWAVGSYNITGVKSLSISGTAGNGYIDLISQSSDPSAPSSGTRLFSNSSNKLSWKGSVGTYAKTFDAGSNTADRVYTLPDATGTIVLDTSTQTITNKDLSSSTNTFPSKLKTYGTGTTASSATPTINTGTYQEYYFSITALALAITSMTTNLSGTPSDGNLLRISITDNGTARSITWGTSFEASNWVSLPTTTIASTRGDYRFVYNGATSKWRIIASD